MKDSEVIATSEFKQRIAETEFLTPYVNDKDKEPIWDGSVHVYSDIDKKVEHDIGRVPVQVKGRTVKKLPKDKITFNGSYKLFNFFNKECGFSVDKEGKIPTSQFTIFRRDFINDEIKELNNISNQNPDNITIQFAVQVLLENYRSASAYLDDMKEESRESIISMPIYNLLRDKLDIA